MGTGVRQQKSRTIAFVFDHDFERGGGLCWHYWPSGGVRTAGSLLKSYYYCATIARRRANLAPPSGGTAQLRRLLLPKNRTLGLKLWQFGGIVLFERAAASERVIVTTYYSQKLLLLYTYGQVSNKIVGQSPLVPSVTALQPYLEKIMRQKTETESNKNSRAMRSGFQQ